MIPVRGKDVYSRKELRRDLLDFNEHSDGPWEPAIFARVYSNGWGVYAGKKYHSVGHDPHAPHDIHLPGDGKSFDVDPVLAKLLIAEVVEET